MTEEKSSATTFQRVRIAGATVDLSTGDVDFGHQAVRLAPRVTDLLATLVASRGEVLSKEALLAQVWGETFVGDDALWRCISELRGIFEAGGVDSLIETLPRRGYRLLAKVEFPDRNQGPQRDATIMPEAVPASSRFGWQWIAGPVAAAAMLALAAGGGRDAPALPSEAPALETVSENSMTAAILAAYSTRRQEALAMHRAGESIKGMTAAGFDMMLRTSATEHLPNALAQSGDIMLARGRPATALQFYQSAMDAGATDPTLQVKAQATLQTVRRVRQGESSLPPEKAEGFDRGETLRIARLQRVNEDFPAALDRLKAILARDPGDESALTELVKLHLSLGDFGNAKETLRRSLDVLPNSVELLTAAAEAELLAGNSTQAMGYLDKACLAWVRARKTMTEATQAPRPLLCWNEAIDELDNAKVAAL